MAVVIVIIVVDVGGGWAARNGVVASLVSMGGSGGSLRWIFSISHRG